MRLPFFGTTLLSAVLYALPAGALPPLLVQFVNVGQGDCELIRTPKGKVILVDAGPEENFPAVEQTLKALKITAIDLFVITHPHADHYGSPRLFSSFTVKELWDSGAPSASKTFLDILREAKRRHSLYLQPSPGLTREIDGCRIEVTAPFRPLLKDTDSDQNNASIAFRLSHGKNSFFFPGDAQLESWEKMFALYPDRLRSDVLKISHHGSRNGTNSGVLIRVRPKVAVISVGNDNRYGHPKAIILRMLDKLGTKIYRTDRDGTISALSDGEKISWSTGSSSGNDHSNEPVVAENPFSSTKPPESEDSALLPDRFDKAFSAEEAAPPYNGRVEILGKASRGNAPVVSVNQASLAELDAVKGMSRKQATAILKARPFGSIEELLRVPGMTRAKFKRLKSKLGL